jgi:hypothetical protein
MSVPKRTFSVLGVTAAVVGAVGAWLAVSGDGGDPTKVPIDERTGAYRGVRFGSSEQEVIRVFGEPVREDGFAPAGELPAEVGVPQSLPGPGVLLRYENVAFLVSTGSGVYAAIVTEEGATTARGVSIGDSLEDARGKYRLKCTRVAGGESLLGEQEFYPSCVAVLEGGVRIWFGRDPVRSFTLLSIPRSRG